MHSVMLSQPSRIWCGNPLASHFTVISGRVGSIIWELPCGVSRAKESSRSRSTSRAIALCIELMEEFPDQLDYRGELLRSCHALGLMHELAGQWADAERAFQQGVAACRPVLPLIGHATYHELPASLHNDLAWLKATRPELRDGDPSEALELAQGRRAGP